MRTERNKKPLEAIAELETRNVEAAITIKQLRNDNEQLSAELRRLKEALTPSVDTKSAYIGEFVYSVDGFDDDGNACSDELCVPWNVIKDIMKAIRERAAAGKCYDCKTPDTIQRQHTGDTHPWVREHYNDQLWHWYRDGHFKSAACGHTPIAGSPYVSEHMEKNACDYCASRWLEYQDEKTREA